MKALVSRKISTTDFCFITVKPKWLPLWACQRFPKERSNERKGVFMIQTLKSNGLRAAQISALAMSALCLMVPATSSFAQLSVVSSSAETKAAVEVLTQQVARSNSLLRSAILSGANGTEALAMSMRVALKLGQGEKLTLDAGQISRLSSLMNDGGKPSLQKNYIVQGLIQMNAALTSSGLQSAVSDGSTQSKYNEALAQQFTALSNQATGALQQSSGPSGTASWTATPVQHLGLVNKVMANLNAALDRCADGSCVLTYDSKELSQAKEALASEFFRAFLKKNAACIGNWKTPNALSTVADGAVALSAILTQLRQAGLTHENIEQAQAAFLTGAAGAMVELKVAKSQREAYELVCRAFTEQPCDLFKASRLCSVKAK